MIFLKLKWLGFCLFTGVADVNADLVRQIHLSRKLIDVSALDFRGAVFTYGSQIQCVKSCLHEGCFSVMYWKSERKCKVNLSPYFGLQTVAGSDVSLFVRKDPTSYNYYEEIGRWLVYRHGSKTWTQAKDACSSETPRARLFQVDSQKKQDVGQKLVKNFGKIFVHIGVYFKVNLFPPPGTWRYIDGTQVGYTCWANRLEPKFSTWAALEKFSGYKWAAVEGLLLTGGWICERY